MLLPFAFIVDAIISQRAGPTFLEPHEARKHMQLCLYNFHEAFQDWRFLWDLFKNACSMFDDVGGEPSLGHSYFKQPLPPTSSAGYTPKHVVVSQN